VCLITGIIKRCGWNRCQFIGMAFIKESGLCLYVTVNVFYWNWQGFLNRAVALPYSSFHTRYVVRYYLGLDMDGRMDRHLCQVISTLW
jgi:hypothetical protein